MIGTVSRCVGLALLILFAATSLGAGSPEPAGPSVQVDCLAGAEIEHPALAWRMLSDITLVVWQSSISVGPDDHGSSIQGQFFRGREVLRSQFQVNSSTPGDQTAPSVTVDEDDNFVVAWASDDNTLRRRIFERVSLQPGPEIITPQSTAGSIDLEPGGGFSASWQNGLDLHGQHFDATGTPVGGELVVDWEETGWDDPRLSRQQIRAWDGGQILSWSCSAIDNSSGNIRSFVKAERFSPGGNSLGRIQVDDGWYAFAAEGDIVGGSQTALVPSGGFVVAYDREYQDELLWDPFYYVKLARFDEAGAPVFGQTVWSSVDPDFHSLSLRALAVEIDDDILVVWDNQDLQELSARRFPSGMPPADETFLISDRPARFSTIGSDDLASVAFADPTSRCAAVWWSQDCDVPTSTECLVIRWFKSYPGVFADGFETGDTSRWCTTTGNG